VLAAMMEGAKVVSGIIARSLVEVEGRVTLPQLRVLVLTSDRKILTMAEVAELLEVHPSNATRLVDRLVQAGLLNRQDDPRNRRQLQLTLTEEGRQLVEAVLDHRREGFRRLLAGLSRDAQAAIADAMTSLAATDTNGTDHQTWVVPLNQRQS
jgi:DNA-binding MarR family transcriptional regulator